MTTKTTATEAVKKSATKPATVKKAQVSPSNKRVTAHGLTLAMLAGLPAEGRRFLLSALDGWHLKSGNVELTKDGVYRLTGKGKEKMAKRKHLAEAQARQQAGGKSFQGTVYRKAPAGWPTPYVFPFGDGDREEGHADSQAAFAALMLAASGK